MNRLKPINRRIFSVIPFLTACLLAYFVVRQHAGDSLKIQQELDVLSAEYEAKYSRLPNANQDYTWFILNSPNTVSLLEKCKESNSPECANRIELTSKIESNHTQLETLNLEYIKLEVGGLLGFGMFCSLLMFFAIRPQSKSSEKSMEIKS